MKKSLLFTFILLVCCCASFTSCSDEKEPTETENTIKYNDLPVEAQKFIRQYFNDQTIYRIEKVTVADMIIFSVYMEFGQIDFNAMGEWTQVAGNSGVSIPFGILPEPVQATLKQRYPGFGVNQVTKEGENFVVVLTNNQGGESITLIFNQSGEIINEPLNPAI